MTPEKPRYRSPTASSYAEVSLEDFSIDDMRRELAHRAGNVDGDFGDSGLPEDLEKSLNTLIVAGQRDVALRELADYLEPFIGKLL